MFERLADQDFAYLTTTGRTTGREHTIEIWFGLHDRRVYFLSGGGAHADWVRNIQRNADVRLRIGSRSVRAKARIVRPGTNEDDLARRLLDGKYQGWHEGKRLSSWARTALPVVIELSASTPRS
ncbi:MAG: nitroreductase family deazaflavin-dependent oxidoreductase [Chloroflexi bacterium]|nr:MAG: nitroreductase family deazaflavin-dependent oxidoreductase [Chloroflexota bacterium]